MKEIIGKFLLRLEPNGKLQKLRPVAGGDINEAYYVRSKENEYFVKLNRDVDASFFDFEAEGLERIAKTNTISVPNVLMNTVDDQSRIHMLWLEWVDGTKRSSTEALLGEQLAAMHLCKVPGYGYTRDGYIGKLRQDNQLVDNWLTYYRDFRLRGQLEIGRARQTITGRRETLLLLLLEQLEKWVPDHPQPSLLHGDLWGGNWLIGEEGRPYLIDPSVLFGDHEFEIAFTELFGGFSTTFYEAYTSVYPLADEYETRKPLYQLYYLLVHVNMFGESYGHSVDHILNRYVG
ncbi:fructosamine kinase family protein [Desertibacillus haloalkaliphilus]|uniref:fructosamine kinase family protein n=1 Tax=Desertibacillus haloalkaliphilus TaxID=1328930 RepID=UPI001C27787C|nr:fructosamine kinase family protein [Desertibacillus haloalkaliphilus]MBU8906153.1 fructosamine kinase family protein [Desertibacillus haloalkaliphilus]